jgi:hypothetical protein
MDDMLPAHRTECYPHHLANLREYATSRLKDILDFAEEMETRTDALPDDLKPIWQALNEITMQALIKSYAELLNHFLEVEFQEITRAPISSQHQTEPDLIEKEK